MAKQVDKEVYQFTKYCDADRWASYYNQIKEMMALELKSILEIGVGDKTVANYIKSNTQVKYQTVDMAEDLQPDIIASVDNLPLADSSCSVVCAFEVLEHLPFEKFDQCLKELKRVSEKYVLISLPHWGRHFSIDMRIPFIKRFRRQHKFSLFPAEHKFDGQHYWEIGKKNYPLKKIRQAITSSGLTIVKDYIVFNSPYHHFFVLKKDI